MKRLLFSLILLVAGVTMVIAEEVTYELTSFNNDAQAFVIKAWGQQPEGSVCVYWSDYGATYGNRFNQIPRNTKADFFLDGWDGCVIKNITLALCSNNKLGTLGLVVSDTVTTHYSQKASEFASEEWFGQWVSKDLAVYVDITKEMTDETPVDGPLTITLKGGTPEGSVYVKRITIEYEPCPSVPTESPMGWVYEKVEAKGSIAEGDVIILYRSGDAAGDIDGMETSKYLDAIGVTNVANLTEYDVCRFTLSRDESKSHWVLTDQFDRVLGATGAQSLAWDAGVMTWDITLGYNGATIASTNTKYGTLRYNAPTSSYPRFWNYTSTSLTLPYIYKRARQLQPVMSTSLVLPNSERFVCLGEQDTIVVKASLLPVSTTDSRIDWTSSDSSIATVNGGVVSVLALGDAVITATSRDGGSTAQMTLHVVEPDAIRSLNVEATSEGRTYDVTPQIYIRKGNKYLRR